MRIAIALYDRFTALDVIGPYQVLAALPGSETFFVAEKRGPVADDSGAVRLEATRSLAEVRDADVVVVGGSPFTHTLIPHDPIIPWLREIHGRTPAPEPAWMQGFCKLKRLHKETVRVQSIIDQEFEIIEPEDRR